MDKIGTELQNRGTGPIFGGVGTPLISGTSAKYAFC